MRPRRSLQQFVMALVAVTGCSFDARLRGGDGGTPDVPDADMRPRVAGARGFWKFDEGTGAMVVDHAVPPATFPPMHLAISTPAATTWVGGGLRLDGRVAVATIANPPHVGRLIDTNTGGSGQVTVEVWVSPANLTQGTDPPMNGLDDFAAVFLASGSIVSYSARIAQVGDLWTARTRTNTMATAEEDAEGLPEIRSPATTVHLNEPIHLAITTSSSMRVFYVNGTPYMSTPTGIAGLEWDRTYTLRFGDAINYDRAWLGTLWMAAIYDRALSQAEIMQNFVAGYNCPEC